MGSMITFSSIYICKNYCYNSNKENEKNNTVNLNKEKNNEYNYNNQENEQISIKDRK